MTRRGMTGQLNMFDFFRELEINSPQNGELEMVSLMPSFEEDETPTPSVESEPVNDVVEAVAEVKSQKTERITKIAINSEVENQENKNNKEKRKQTEHKRDVKKVHEIDISHDRPVMQRSYTTKQGTVEIAYINYGKVRVTEPGQEPEIKEFASSKEAVDYYVEQMQKLEELYQEDK